MGVRKLEPARGIAGERPGHASIGITLDTYSHVLPNLQEETIRDFDAWLSASV